MVQSPAGSIQQQQAAAQQITNNNVTTSNQPIIVPLTVSGEELATVGYVERRIEAQVPKVMADNRSPTIGY